MFIPAAYFSIASTAPAVNTGTGESAAGGSLFGDILLVIGVFAVFFVVAGLATMGMFKKAARRPWEAFIPVYSSVVLFRIAGISGWWIIAALVPVLNVVTLILLAVNLAKVFGKGAGTAVLIVFFSLIMYCYFSYGRDRYFGPQAASLPFGAAGNEARG